MRESPIGIESGVEAFPLYNPSDGEMLANLMIDHGVGVALLIIVGRTINRTLGVPVPVWVAEE
jgi:hypothetical protein